MSDENFVRSRNHGCFRIADSPAWGRYLIPIDDPEGTPLSEKELEGIQLIENFPKVSKEIWARIVNLYFYLCDDKKEKIKNQRSELEVSVLFLRKADDLNVWRVVVPSQIVSGAAVQADFEKTCDIVTGEELKGFPPEGWVHAGSSHSHNTMGAFFSHIDDKNELSVPGLHIVVGKIDKKKMTYGYEASIVLQQQRKFVKLDDVVDAEAIPRKFHQKVLEYIKVKKDKEKKVSKKFHGFREFLEHCSSEENPSEEDALYLSELLGSGENIFDTDELLIDELRNQIKED